jgi:sodium pump decarboxylase gamma subunit
MMNISVLLATAAGTVNISERASTAGIVTLQGMLTIFAVLAILWAMIEIMHAVLNKGEKKEKEPSSKKEAPAASAAPKQDDATAPAAIVAENDGAIVAAITAAISAARAEAGETGAFRVVSFKHAECKRGARR